MGFFLLFFVFDSGQLSRLLLLAKSIIIRDVNETNCKTSRRSLKGPRKAVFVCKVTLKIDPIMKV